MLGNSHFNIDVTAYLNLNGENTFAAKASDCGGLWAFATQLYVLGTDGTVYIPDANFKAALVSNSSINTNGDGEIQVSEASAYNGALDVSNLGISDLTGIEAFTSIWQLNCFQNNLISLDVSACTNLYWLECRYNQISSLVMGSDIAYLYCAYNQLSNLDLSNLIYLTNLDCSYNLLTNIDVTNSPSLFLFYCGFNNISYADVTQCPNLYFFSIDHNIMTTVDVSQNPSLFILACSHNQLSTVDVSANSALYALAIDSNTISNLNLATNPNLNILNCGVNLLNTLDLSSNTALTSLSCYNNQLTNLDLSQNLQLTLLSCENNQLTSLNLSANPLLAHLGCGFNQISSLDLSQNPSITSLFCGYNQLTGLDLSTNTSLGQLSCTDNQLTNLNLNNGNNANMNYFFALNNPNLTCIQVDDYNYMDANWSNGKDAIAAFSNTCTGCTIPTITTTPAVTDNVCPGTALKLTSSKQNNYAWNNGKTTRSIQPNIDGSYQVATISPSGCRSISAPTTVSYQLCNAPIGISITNPTNTTALVNFVSASCGQTYEIIYRINQTDSPWIKLTGINSSPYTFEGLLPNTEYTMRMRTKCSSTPLRNSAWSIRYIFKTPVNLTADGGFGTQYYQVQQPAFTLSLSPNPASSVAVLSISGNKKNVSVSIADMAGRQLWQSVNISATQLRLPITPFASGIYLVTVCDGEQKQVIKLIKE